MKVRAASDRDHDAIWKILQPIIRAGETYALPREMSREAALAYWLADDREVFVAEDADEVVGTYCMRANQPGGGSHVANCGYVTAPWAMGRGVARAMCRHSLVHAKARGFRAMQFNFVVSTNKRAVQLWQSLGFAVAGRLPDAFKHPSQGYVDALVMYRDLNDV